MKKIVKTTIILAAVALLCGALIGVAQFITGPIIQRNSEKRANAVYLEYFVDLEKVETKEVNGKYVYQVLTVKDNENKTLGFIFKGKDNNNFGLIDVIVVADINGNLIGTRILQTENTSGIYDKHINNDNSLKAVIGDNVGNLQGVEAQTGATVTGGSLNAILREVKEIAPDYMDVEVELDPHQKLFGEDAKTEEDETFIPTEIVTKREIVKDAAGNKVGYVYTATNYRNVPYSPDAELTLAFGIDNEGKVVGIIEVVSKHTQDPKYYGKYTETIGNIKDIDVADLEIDLETGATISHGALNELFEAVKEATLDLHERLYGKGVTKAVDESFTPTEIVTKKEVIKDAEGNEVGYIYTATNYRDIPYSPNAELTLLVAFDNNGRIMKVVEVVNKHTQAPKYYGNYTDTVANIKDIDVVDLEIDLETGATISHGALTELFNAIKEAEGL